MTDYNVHFFDRDGLISHIDALARETLEDAIQTVSAYPHRHSMTLCCDGQIMRRFNPKGPLGFKHHPPLMFAGQRSWFHNALTH